VAREDNPTQPRTWTEAIAEGDSDDDDDDPGEELNLGLSTSFEDPSESFLPSYSVRLKLGFSRDKSAAQILEERRKKILQQATASTSGLVARCVESVLAERRTETQIQLPSHIITAAESITRNGRSEKRGFLGGDPLAFVPKDTIKRRIEEFIAAEYQRLLEKASAMLRQQFDLTSFSETNQETDPFVASSSSSTSTPNNHSLVDVEDQSDMISTSSIDQELMQHFSSSSFSSSSSSSSSSSDKNVLIVPKQNKPTVGVAEGEQTEVETETGSEITRTRRLQQFQQQLEKTLECELRRMIEEEFCIDNSRFVPSRYLAVVHSGLHHFQHQPCIISTP